REGGEARDHPGREPDPPPGFLLCPEGQPATRAPRLVVIDLRAKELSGLPLKLGNVSHHTRTPCRKAGWDASPGPLPGFQQPCGGTMTERTYRVTEIVGTSPDGIEPAIRNAVHRAAQTLRHLDWFEVTQVRGQITDGEVAHYQVGLKVGFRLEDS